MRALRARLTVHAPQAQLRCHHCGAERQLEWVCPTCGSERIAVGAGTQRVDDELAALFPRARDRAASIATARSRKGALAAVLDEVASGRVDILVGTQMFTKGHDFPRVTLVGVLNADQGLFGTDPRSHERLAQTILQVAGRAGRAERPGEVVIQTHYAEHPLLSACSRRLRGVRRARSRGASRRCMAAVRASRGVARRGAQREPAFALLGRCERPRGAARRGARRRRRPRVRQRRRWNARTGDITCSCCCAVRTAARCTSARPHARLRGARCAKRARFAGAGRRSARAVSLRIESRLRSMARSKRNTRRRESAPGWLWMLLGIGIGLVIAAGVYYRRPGSPGSARPRRNRPLPDSARATPAETPRGKSAAQSKGRAAPAARQPRRPPPRAERRFEFYDILPQYEVVVPEVEAVVGAGAARVKPIHEPGSYVLQAGSFGAAADADKVKASIALLGIESRIQSVTIDDAVYHRVRIGPIRDLDELNRMRKQTARRAHRRGVMKVME